MAEEAPLFATQKGHVVTFTDGSGTPIVYTFRVSPDGWTETPKRQRADVEATDTDGVVVAVRKEGAITKHPEVTFTNLRIHSCHLGSTAISGSAGSLLALVRGTGPSGWTSTDTARAPDHVTGTLLITTPDAGTAKGESRSNAKARLVDENLEEKTDPKGRFFPSIRFVCIDEPTITVNS